MTDDEAPKKTLGALNGPWLWWHKATPVLLGGLITITLWIATNVINQNALQDARLSALEISVAKISDYSTRIDKIEDRSNQILDKINDLGMEQARAVAAAELAVRQAQSAVEAANKKVAATP